MATCNNCRCMNSLSEGRHLIFFGHVMVMMENEHISDLFFIEIYWRSSVKCIPFCCIIKMKYVRPRCVTPYSTWISRIIAEVFRHCDAILLTSRLTFIYHQYYVINESNRRMVWILRTNSICALPEIHLKFSIPICVWIPCMNASM